MGLRDALASGVLVAVLRETGSEPMLVSLVHVRTISPVRWRSDATEGPSLVPTPPLGVSELYIVARSLGCGELSHRWVRTEVGSKTPTQRQPAGPERELERVRARALAIVHLP